MVYVILKGVVWFAAPKLVIVAFGAFVTAGQLLNVFNGSITDATPKSLGLAITANDVTSMSLTLLLSEPREV
jgi:hypothetical protein